MTNKSRRGCNFWTGNNSLRAKIVSLQFHNLDASYTGPPGWQPQLQADVCLSGVRKSVSQTYPSQRLNDGFSINDDELRRAPGHDVKAGVHLTRVGGAEVSRSYDNHDRSLQSQDALRLGDLNEVRFLWSNKSVNTRSVAPSDDVDRHAPCLQASDKARRPLFWWCGTDVKVRGVAAVGTTGGAGHGVRRDVIKTVNVARDENVAEPDGFLGSAFGSCSSGNFSGKEKESNSTLLTYNYIS